ncbi:TPA: hypothetical protein ACLFWE_001501, partial [Salmonella enterica subsp. houtenae serovar O:57:z4,z32:-]
YLWHEYHRQSAVKFIALIFKGFLLVRNNICCNFMFGAVFNEDIFHCNEYSPALWKIFIR